MKEWAFDLKRQTNILWMFLSQNKCPALPRLEYFLVFWSVRFLPVFPGIYGALPNSQPQSVFRKGYVGDPTNSKYAQFIKVFVKVWENQISLKNI